MAIKRLSYWNEETGALTAIWLNGGDGEPKPGRVEIDGSDPSSERVSILLGGNNAGSAIYHITTKQLRFHVE